MERQRPKLPNEDNTRTTFHYDTRSSSRRGIATSDRVDDESALLRVTKERKVSDERSTNSDLHIPIDLIVEILRRLPAKSLAKFLCVSKIWGTIIRSRDFRKLFLKESSNRPGRLFFTFEHEHDSILFSSNETESLATYHLTHPVCKAEVKFSSSCVHDLICYVNASRSELVVYNSTTKTSITLPNLELPGKSFLRHFLGYDPVDAVYKVLCICINNGSLVIKVLTLGNGNEWRILKISLAYIPFNRQIYINGVLYYDAYAWGGSQKLVVMSFDVRSEKFHLIIGPGGADFPRHRSAALTMYEGKLTTIPRAMPTSSSVDIWVLEDTVKHEWLKKTFVLPNYWTSLAQETYRPSPPHESHGFLDISAAGEFILAPLSACVAPFYVLFYDPKRNSMRKVSIEGIMEHELLQWNKKNPWFLYNIFSSQAESLTLW